jgi:hypothetical protein
MSGRKVDFFGTFLENLKTPTPSGSVNSPSAAGGAQSQPGPDPLNEVLKALRGGPLPAKNLIPLVGNSVSQFLAISSQLVDLGWVIRLDGDQLQLTDKGREVAAVLE